jgi:hypothetical protein
MAARNSYILTGGNGATYIDGTADTTPPSGVTHFIAIQALTATVLDQSDMAATNETNWEDFDVDVTIPAGSTVFGRFTNINLVSGTCLAYHE